MGARNRHRIGQRQRVSVRVPRYTAPGSVIRVAVDALGDDTLGLLIGKELADALQQKVEVWQGHPRPVLPA